MTHITKMQQQALAAAEYYEQLFMKVTGAKPRKNKQEEYRHVDCYLGDVSIDVKGARSCQRDGYVLVEFKNVAGNDGWCSRNSADKIAFYFDEGFIVVDTMDLRRIAERKVMANPLNVGGKVTRANKVGASAGLYLLCGRDGRKDVFTYITKDDLLGLNHDVYEHQNR